MPNLYTSVTSKLFIQYISSIIYFLFEEKLLNSNKFLFIFFRVKIPFFKRKKKCLCILIFLASSFFLVILWPWSVFGGVFESYYLREGVGRFGRKMREYSIIAFLHDQKIDGSQNNNNNNLPFSFIFFCILSGFSLLFRGCFLLLYFFKRFSQARSFAY